MFVNLPEFIQIQLHRDSTGTTYPRKLAINDSYSGQDVAFGQFGNILYNFKDLIAATTR